jgi:cobalt-zinc-cadmium efflux system outer membrane protein
MSGRAFRPWILICYSWLAMAHLGAVPGLAGTPLPEPHAVSHALSIDAAVVWALQNNPELAAQRQQRGIAAAGVVIARTYPFNPVWEGKMRAANGPASAGITNHFSNEHKLLIDVEVRHQGRYRREAAGAALSRSEWEIASQEVALAIRVARAFNTLVYRQEKLRFIEEAIRGNEHDVEDLRKLVEKDKADREDLLLARIELDDSRAQVGPGKTALATALHELRRALGVVDEAFEVHGALETHPRQWNLNALTQAALEKRAELHARLAALHEADAKLRLEVANRYGNPNIGPAYEYDPARINLIGAQIVLPLPILNTRRGEIMQREAERTRAALELRQTETQIRQDVEAALARLKEASASQATYQNQLRPRVRARLAEIDRLRKGKDKVDVAKLLEGRRKLLKSDDGYLDALWEVSQAVADLAAAVGDPALAIAPCLTAQGNMAAVAPEP